MHRVWSGLFFVVPAAGILFVMAAAFSSAGMAHFWLPPSIGPRTAAIDALLTHFHVIFAVFLLVFSTVFSLALWRFAAHRTGPASHIHSNWRLEIAWTLLPAFLLVGLAFYQYPVWQENKVKHPVIDTKTGAMLQSPHVRVVARQYNWLFVYPGADQTFDTRDDLFSEGELVLPAHTCLVLELVSQDVIHSFCINELRLKQDVVPGFSSHIWFEISKVGEWEILCTELCGWGHYKMKARLRAVTAESYDTWLASLRQHQFYLTANPVTEM